MRGFLDEVSTCLPEDNSLLSETVVLLPTKRACHYFRNALLNRRKGDTVWLPEILSLREFLFRESPLVIAGEEDLVALLYSVYERTLGLQQDFASFYPWGQTIVKDFDDIDKYLIDPDYLFHYVREYKALETGGRLTEEQLAWMRRFWDTVGGDDAGGVRGRFLKTWEQLGALYTAFRAALSQEGLAYEGMAYRNLLDRLEGGERRLPFTYAHIVGFNALSAFEERLFQHLARHYETRLYWDATTSQLDDPADDSGQFIRRYCKLFPESSNSVIAGDSAYSEKELVLVDAGLDADQCRAGLNLAGSWGASDTVIVLSDESLVLPLLYQLESDSPLNITMGYPASVSGVVRFLENSCAFHAEMRAGKGIRASVLGSLLAFGPLAVASGPDLCQSIRNSLRSGVPVNPANLGSETAGGPEVWTHLLADRPILPYLRAVLGSLERFFPATEAVEPAIARACLQETERLEARLERLHITMTDQEAGAFLLKRLASLRVPFAGQDGKGPQVMGFLETRNLDFENVIILGACDEFLPGTSGTTSFIPFSIRRALGLPTYRESDAIYAYHFYRLIKRARRVALVYSLQSPTGKRSRSRLVEQLLYVPPSGLTLRTAEWTYRLSVPASPAPELLQIEKDVPEVRQSLERFLCGSRELSASAINLYVRCPVQFYLAYVADLKEPEDLSESLDQRDLGRVFHKAMELFYRPLLEQDVLVDANAIEARLREAPPADLVYQGFVLEGYTRAGTELLGRNLLIRQVIVELMERILEKDAAGEPFRVIGLEKRVVCAAFDLGDGRTVPIKGYLDRVDLVEASGGAYVRIVDYKTGKPSVYSRKNKEAADYFSSYFSNPAYREGLQAYLYAWMFRRSESDLPIRAGFYSARGLHDGLICLQQGQFIDDGDFLAFEEQLRRLLREMFDLSVPFIQSDKPDAYRYSAYAMLVE